MSGSKRTTPLNQVEDIVMKSLSDDSNLSATQVEPTNQTPTVQVANIEDESTEIDSSDQSECVTEEDIAQMKDDGDEDLDKVNSSETEICASDIEEEKHQEDVAQKKNDDDEEFDEGSLSEAEISASDLLDYIFSVQQNENAVHTYDMENENQENVVQKNDDGDKELDESSSSETEICASDIEQNEHPQDVAQLEYDGDEEPYEGSSSETEISASDLLDYIFSVQQNENAVHTSDKEENENQEQAEELSDNTSSGSDTIFITDSISRKLANLFIQDPSNDFDKEKTENSVDQNSPISKCEDQIQSEAKKIASFEYQLLDLVHQEEQQTLNCVAFNPYSNQYYLATAGEKCFAIYTYLNTGDTFQPEKLTCIESYNDPNDEYFSVVWGYNKVTNKAWLFAGGQLGIIRMIDPYEHDEIRRLQGHAGKVNDLKGCHWDTDLLLSASEDYSIKLWNVRQGVQLAILAGSYGHCDQVLSISVHMLSKYVASSSIDCHIRIWRLDTEQIDQVVSLGAEWNQHREFGKRQFPTKWIHVPHYITRSVHYNYIDSVCWFGDLLLSKSSEGKLCLWKPGPVEIPLSQMLDSTLADLKFGFEHSQVHIVREFVLTHCNIWWLKMALDPNQALLAVGNTRCQVHIFDFKGDELDKMGLVGSLDSAHILASSLRAMDFSPDGKLLAGVTENAHVIVYQIRRLNIDDTETPSTSKQW